MKLLVKLIPFLFIWSCDFPKEYQSAIVIGDNNIAYIFKENGRYGLKDTLGNIITPAKYDYIENYQMFGKVRVDLGGYDDSGGDYISYKMNKIGLIDVKTGEVIFEPQFDQLHYSWSGMAVVEKNDKFGYINKAGNYVIELQYEEAFPFMENFAIVKSNGKYGLIDSTNHFALKPEYEYIMQNYVTGVSRDTLGLILISEDTSVYKYIDRKGNIFDK